MSLLLRRSETFRDTPPPVRERPAKIRASSRYFWRQDVLGRALALLLAVPVLLIVALLAVVVRLTSRGPAIFRQERVGLHGRTFTMYKIRTMRQDAEQTTGPVWSAPGDPRVTWFGRLLRVFHLDELPQILNVLQGDMAWIGPRPERPDFTNLLAIRIPGYLERLRVKPGITGLAQVNFPPDTDLDSVRRKLVVDLEYVENACLRLDLSIFLCTFLRLFGLKGRWTTRLFGIRRRVALTSPANNSCPTPALMQPSPNGKKAR